MEKMGRGEKIQVRYDPRSNKIIKERIGNSLTVREERSKEGVKRYSTIKRQKRTNG